MVNSILVIIEQTQQRPAMRLLIVKRDKIGDLLLTTPLLAVLRAALPNAQIHVLASDYNAWVLDGNPDVDRVWVYRRLRTARISFDAIAGLLRLVCGLRAQRFDVALVANGSPSPRAAAWARRAGAKQRIGYASGTKEARGLTQALAPLTELHEVDRLLRLAAAIGVPFATPAPFPRYVLPAASAAAARAWLSQQSLASGSYIVLGLGARRVKKQPSVDQVLRWSAYAKHAWNMDTVFMWTPGTSTDLNYPGDDAVAASILARAPAYLHPFRGPLPPALGLIWGARGSVFPDSGLMHFAAASPGGVIGLFAETKVSPPPSQWGPYGERASYLEAEHAVTELNDTAVLDRLGRLVSLSASPRTTVD
jgi:ADP-heptose:LPS heptosyltransferase